MDKKPEVSQVEDAARQTGLNTRIIRRCVRIGLVSTSLTDDDLAELRRVRRLTELDVNLVGAEIIVRMHHRILRLLQQLGESPGVEDETWQKSGE